VAALRERYSSRDGLGHADRPRQHNAVGLDSQPWRICLSAGRCLQSNSNTDCIANSYGYADTNSHCDPDSYANGNINAETYSHSEICSHTTAASYTGASPVAMVISDL
jgi:hypothetical protein